MKNKILIAIVVLLFSLGNPVNVKAQSPQTFNLPVQQTLPGTSGYLFKRLKEKISGSFKFSATSKFMYRQILLEKRVSEFVSLVENKNQLQIADASQRLAYQSGVLAENSYNGSLEDRKLIIGLFTKYKPILEKMRDNFSANSSFWLLSQQNIDTFNILSEKLK